MRRESRGQEADEKGMLGNKLSIRNCGWFGKERIEGTHVAGPVNS